jgi:septal ring factor EnvC (AmiA/AmiB activator)
MYAGHASALVSFCLVVPAVISFLSRCSYTDLLDEERRKGYDNLRKKFKRAQHAIEVLNNEIEEHKIEIQNLEEQRFLNSMKFLRSCKMELIRLLSWLVNTARTHNHKKKEEEKKRLTKMIRYCILSPLALLLDPDPQLSFN